jgi:hypothetical protein
MIGFLPRLVGLDHFLRADPDLHGVSQKRPAPGLR